MINVVVEQAVAQIATLVASLEAECERLSAIQDAAFDAGAHFDAEGRMVTVGADGVERPVLEAEEAAQQEERLRRAIVRLDSARRALLHEGTWPEDEELAGV